MSRRLRVALAVLVAVVLLAPLGWLWQQSLLPGRYAVDSLGEMDDGHGHLTPAHPPGPGATSVADLVVDPERPADVRFDLTARQQPVAVPGAGITVPGYTVNGTSPGPTLVVHQGQLVEVVLHNASVPAGVTLHWHGVDVPNAMDGVAGVTQDAVGVGGQFVYRFVATKAGSYWYHSHQVSHEQVIGGLYGALVVLPEGATYRAIPGARNQPAVPTVATVTGTVDVVALAHTYAGHRTLDGVAGNLPVAARPGQQVRVRVINTDDAQLTAWSSVSYRLAAVDGWEVHGAGVVAATGPAARSVQVTAGGRADLVLTMPADGTPVRVQVGKATAVVLGRGTDVAAPPVPPQPTVPVDLLSYGTPAPIGFDPTRPDRTFDYTVSRLPGFVRGRPGIWWAINGRLFPRTPMFEVAENDVVVMHLDNESNESHPLHLHGHHAVVLARDGVAATGAPWWFDTLEVESGQTFDVAFVADNPGLWMDHCHNLQHAADGMVAHLMYTDVSTPYRVGTETDNDPE